MGYVYKFNNVEEIKECAKYYIQILGLQDWRIVFELGIPSSEDNAGECISFFEQKSAKIILNINEPASDNFIKQPQELVLIHELCHCKIELYDNNSLDGKMIYQHQHTLIDDWARSIFYTRYNLTHEDFYFTEEEQCQ